MPRWRVGVLTCSTLGAKGKRADVSGKLLKQLCESWLDARVAAYQLLPDDRRAITACLKRWCAQRLDLIVTTGGTGFSPTDVTPEATRAVIQKEVPGLSECMRSAGARHTPLSWLSRSVCGIRGRTLIVNLPGSPRAVREALGAIRKVLPHALDIVSGSHAGRHSANADN